MKIDFNTVLKDLNDVEISQPIINDESKVVGKEILTLGLISRSALLNLSQDDATLSGIKKQERYFLARKINKSEKEKEPVNLVSEDITLLKKLIGKQYTPMIVGCTWDILDPEQEKK